MKKPSKLQEAGTSLRPCLFPRVRSSEYSEKRVGRILRFHDCVQGIGDWRHPAEVAVSRVSMAETPGTTPRELPDPDVRKGDPCERVEHVHLACRRQIALHHAAWQRAMLSPLHVHGGRSMSAPIGVQDLPMPVGPDVRRLARRRVEADPHDLFVRWHGERYARSIHVIT